jgi:hypothetical protein
MEEFFDFRDLLRVPDSKSKSPLGYDLKALVLFAYMFMILQNQAYPDGDLDV